MHNAAPKRLLLADNSAEYRRSMRGHWQLENYLVQEAGSPEEARALLESGQFDLALVDMRLTDDTDDADFSGFEIAMRAAELGIRSIIITLFPDVDPVRRALRSRGGNPLAVDFIKKTDGPQALLDSIRLVFDHVEAAPEPPASPARTGPLRGQPAPAGLHIDLTRKLVWRNGASVNLSKKQYALVEYLYQKEGVVCSPEELLQAIYADEDAGKDALIDHRLQNLVDRLKEKLEEPGSPVEYVVNVPGRGYRLDLSG